MTSVSTTDSPVEQARSELLDDQILSILDVARICAPPGKPVTKQNVYRWAKLGIKVAPDRRVKLKLTRLPRTSIVKGADLRSFLRELQAGRGGMDGQPGRMSKPELALAGDARFLVGTAR